MSDNMKMKFDKYWKNYSIVLAFGAILDPRLKDKFLKFCYTTLDASTSEGKLKNVMDKFKGLYEEYDFKTWNSIESRFVLGKNELDIYFDDELLELNEEHSEDFDVLLYWKFNEKKFPILSIMARDVLSIPITTVASESSFSIGGRVLTKYRSSTLPEHIQMLICTRSWLHGFSENMNDEEDINANDEGNTEVTMTQHTFGLQD
ncbi:zinc finger BED domain-containing protein DAYSLEEPER [Lathyrus oleraceus]|uniref:zinc finger BED domain-containing protein DAYSLEEPER n=1 Tax=Pisum sativum TaxID=3888 RepID=UPI0021CF55C2|nr:zinc finger BED domain-containing protein DAYSLEEPER-like [Pisum sativum]